MVGIYNSPNSNGGLRTREMGEDRGRAHLISPPCNKQCSTGEAKMSGGELWAPAGQTSSPLSLPPLLLLRTAMLFVTVPLADAVSRIFNAKWAKIQHFLAIQGIDSLLGSARGPIINVSLLLMGVCKNVHIIQFPCR